jgi:hypothetical protein
MRSVAALGVAALAVLCCAGAPLIVALVGGLTVAGALSMGGGVLVASGLAVGVAMLLRARRRRTCMAPRSMKEADA